MKRRKLLALVVAALAAATLAGTFLAGRAIAGIGPAGFAFYARQGIVREINQVYGNGNSPYNVRCTEVPNYRTISDVVTCTIREKP